MCSIIVENSCPFHIQLSFIALFIATLIAVPIAILLTKTKKLSEIVMNIAAVLQTIP
jgi:ABC-type proline/glycine betaine transport system permease subunit